MSSIVIISLPPHQYRFKLIDESGCVLLTGTQFKVQDSCYDAIEDLKTFASFQMNYILETAGTKFFFNLMDDKGFLIGTSELYANEEEREKGIKDVSDSARYAPVLKPVVQ